MSGLYLDSLVQPLARDGNIKIGWGAGMEPRPASEQISRREWFVTHAPPVPDWFRYKAKGQPPVAERELPDPEKELWPVQQDELRAWQAGDTLDFAALSPAVREFMLRWQKINAANEVFHEWRMKSREEKWWAWRNHFADEMMKASHGK